MSYPPFAPEHGKQPYPPSLSYPSAPPLTGSYLPGQQPMRTPYPSSSLEPPAAGFALSSNPYCQVNSSSLQSSLPYSLKPSSAAYMPSTGPYPPSAAPYPPSAAPYPPSAAPYPPSGAPYPPSGAPYPPSGAPYPPSGAPYPPSGAPYPPSAAPYPPSAAPYPTSAAPYPTSSNFLPKENKIESTISANKISLSYAPPTQSTSNFTSQNLTNPQGYQHGHTSPKTNPTVRPIAPFYPRQDAEILRKAMKGFGTDEATIISVLTNRSNMQRQEIAKEFKTLYGKDLVKDLKSETSGHFEDVLVALMTPLPEFYAKEVHHAMSGIGTTESTLIEIFCSLCNSEIQYLKMAYQALFSTSLEEDLASDTSGHFKRLLISLSQGRRDETTVVDMEGAANDAQALLRAGELKFGTDESTFNAILCSRSFAQLRAIFTEYERITGHTFEKAIKNEFSGDLEDGLLGIVKCARNRTEFLAECLYKSMAGMGTRDRDLIRLIVTRSEIDLEDVKLVFNSKYGKSLESFIKGEVSGDYKKCLLAIVE